MKKLLTLINILLLVSSIQGQDNPIDHVDFFKVDDLNFEVFKDARFENYYNKTYDEKAFLEHYFRDWDVSKSTKAQTISEAEWKEYFTYSDITKRSPCYAGNYQKHSQSLIDELKSKLPADKENYPHLVRAGMITESTDVRGLPTEEFCLKQMRDAGEGYPFDYLQYSAIWIGTPVKVLSKTIDDLWYFVSTPNNKGWVKANTIAFVSSTQIKQLKQMDYGAVLKKNLALKGKRATELDIGVLLPMINSKSNSSILVPHRSFEDNSLIFDTIRIQGDAIQKFPIRFDAANVRNVLNELIGGKYSWGGLDKGRDCSSTLKDYFTPFGIWLPRNSSQQFKSGKQIELKNGVEEKAKTIIKEGIPFLSSVYKRGHIMLYVGTKDTDEPLIFHTVWGLKAYFKDEALKQVADHRDTYGIFGIDRRDFLKDEVQARFIIAKTVITSIEPTKNLLQFNKIRLDSFLESIYMLTILSDKP